MVIFRKDRQIQRKDIVSARNASPAAHFSRSCCVFLQFVAKSLYQKKSTPGSMHCPGSAKRFSMEDGGPVPREKRFGQEAGKDMKYTVGITSWCWPDFSSAAFPRIKNAGFDTLQLEVGSWEDGLPLSKREIRKEYAEVSELGKEGINNADETGSGIQGNDPAVDNPGGGDGKEV